MLDLAIVGAGVMGTNHARVARALRDARVAYVVDPDLERAKAAAEASGAEARRSIEDVVGRVDAAVIAVPSALHVSAAVPFLEHGTPVLVEKPIAPTVEEAAMLVALAARRGTLLMTGHVERFNPAVLALDSILTDVVHISAARISPFSARVDDDVVIDLMIHDLDLVLSIVRQPVVSVLAVGRKVRSTTNDITDALLTFENGVTASLSASRVGQGKIRTLDITQGGSYVSVDLLRQDVTISRVDHSEYLSAEGARYRQSGVIEIPFLEHRGEPLLIELEDFVRSIIDGSPPRVTGSDGLAALDLTVRVLAASV